MRPRRLNHIAVTSALIGFVLSVMWLWSHIGAGATAYALDGIGSVENDTTFQIAAASVTLNTGALLIQRPLDFDPERNTNPNTESD